ncbi:hypothetical protein HG531_002357 [Fusarium graminearum]|nr:hypothetical protein HG531_002357 [Fusarium graminearum]
MENGAISQGEGKDPSSFLGNIIGNPVTVKLNSGVVYKGELQSVDGYMNIALEKTAEYVNGQKRREYGDAFVRGNNDNKGAPMKLNLAFVIDLAATLFHNLVVLLPKDSALLTFSKRVPAEGVESVPQGLRCQPNRP